MTVACMPWTLCKAATRALLCGVLGVLLGACHGNNITPPGTAVITMGGNAVTNADFAAYIVAVDSITLVQANGLIATPLVTPQVVDLAQVHELAELVEAPAVPFGTYTSATITLDYSAANIWVNVNGQPVSATAVDTSGNTLLSVTLTITFDPANPVVITIGQSIRLQVDIDMMAFNTIDTSTSPPKVTVRPYAMITPAPLDTTEMRARGVFVTVQPGGASQFIMNMRPFVDQVSALGAVFVNTNSQTYFNVNGAIFTGAAGLAAMAQQPQNIPMAARGTLTSLSGPTPTFNASEVYMGTSLQSPLADFVTGTIASRSGDTLNVIGASYVSRFGILSFLSSLPLEVSSATTVSMDGVPANSLTAQAISVGQRITASGQSLTNSSGGLASLDVTQGALRLAQTRLFGTLNSATPTVATLDVMSLGNFVPQVLNFAGTGASSAQDANPAAYTVNTGSVDESGTAPGTLLQGIGIVSPFGGAPPDFTATTSIPGSSTEQLLLVAWSPGDTHPFTSVGNAGLVVDLTSSLIYLDYIRTGPAELNLTSLPMSPLITTVGANQANLWLAIGSSSLASGISVFNSAAAFTTAVNSTFSGTNQIARLVAYGQYNSAANTFVASRIYIVLS